MRALVGTGVLLCGCLLLALIVGRAGTVTIIWLVVTVIIAGLNMSTNQRQWEIATPAAYLLVGALSTDSVTGAPLVVYTLAHLGALTARRTRIMATATCVPFVAAVAPRVQGTPMLALVLVFCVLAVLLVLRTVQEEAARRSLHAVHDDLREKVLTLQDTDAQLLQAQDYELRATALAGRTRIIREIHDGVGHLLTRLLLQVKTLRVVHREEPSVVVDYPVFWQMTVDNDGIVPAGGEPTAAGCSDPGLGLRFMTERVEALGGRVHTTPWPRFAVFVTIPKDGQGGGEAS